MATTALLRDRRLRARRGGRADRRGFTLTEIMIALGVMVVGMGMAAGAFHAGIHNHLGTVDDIVRGLVSENAIAIAKVRVRHPNETISENYVVIPNDATDAIGQEDKSYPVRIGNELRSRHGYVLLFKKANYAIGDDSARNDYMIGVVPYSVQTDGDYVESELMPGDEPTFKNEDEVSKIRLRDTDQMQYVQPGKKILTPDESGRLVMATVVEETGSKEVLLDKRVLKGRRPVILLVVRNEAGSEVDTQQHPERTPELLEPYEARTALPPASTVTSP